MGLQEMDVDAVDALAFAATFENSSPNQAESNPTGS